MANSNKVNTYIAKLFLFLKSLANKYPINSGNVNADIQVTKVLTGSTFPINIINKAIMGPDNELVSIVINNLIESIFFTFNTFKIILLTIKYITIVNIATIDDITIISKFT